MSLFSVGHEITGSSGLEQLTKCKQLQTQQSGVRMRQSLTSDVFGRVRCDNPEVFTDDMLSKYGEPREYELESSSGDNKKRKIYIWKDKNDNNVGALMYEVGDSDYRNVAVRIDGKQMHITEFLPLDLTRHVDISTCSEQKMPAERLFESILERYDNEHGNVWTLLKKIKSCIE